MCRSFPYNTWKNKTRKCDTEGFVPVANLYGVVRKATAHVETKTLNMRHQAQKGFLRNLRGNTTAPKRIPGLRTQY